MYLMAARGCIINYNTQRCIQDSKHGWLSIHFEREVVLVPLGPTTMPFQWQRASCSPFPFRAHAQAEPCASRPSMLGSMQQRSNMPDAARTLPCQSMRRQSKPPERQTKLSTLKLRRLSQATPDPFQSTSANACCSLALNQASAQRTHWQKRGSSPDCSPRTACVATTHPPPRPADTWAQGTEGRSGYNAISQSKLRAALAWQNDISYCLLLVKLFTHHVRLSAQGPDRKKNGRSAAANPRSRRVATCC